MRSRRAFTLIELLTVMAITAVMMTLIIVPVVQSFNLTRAAQAFADAQDKARLVTERISREIGNAASVRDLSRTAIWDVNGSATPVAGHTLAVTLPAVQNDGTPQSTDTPNLVQVLLPNSKLDLVLPAESGERDANGAFINPTTGLADPTLKAPKGPVSLPVLPGQTMVRWFVGLREPVRVVNGELRANLYNDPYTGLLRLRNGQRDNLYVLYRSEFVANDGVSDNPALFSLDASNRALDFDDPAFFSFIPGIDISNVSTGALTPQGVLKARRMIHWLGRAPEGYVQQPSEPAETLWAKTTLQTEISRYDMVQPLYDRRSRQVKNNAGIPQVLSLIQFTPERVSNEPAEAATTVRLGDEATGISAAGSDVFTTQHGLWSNYVVRVYPNRYNPNDNQRNEYLEGRRRTGGSSVFAIDPDGGNPTEVFDISTFENPVVTSNGGSYGFSAGVLAANARSGWLSSDRLREIFVPFDASSNRGKVVTSFGIDQVGNPTGNGAAINRPIVETSVINQRYADQVAANPGLAGRIHRYIDLRVTAQQDGTFPPLYPNFVAGTPSGFSWFNDATGMRQSRVIVTPGSEEVWGPDQLSGVGEVRYSRTNGEPGPNQYRINYTDLAEPTNPGTGNLDYSFAYPGFGNPPANYDSTNFVSAALQPRYRAGYIQLNSDPQNPLPQGQVTVSYRFQFTNGKVPGGNGDRLSVDYDTRELISVLLTIRNYPQASIPNPQSVTLKATAAVRNYIR